MNGDSARSLLPLYRTGKQMDPRVLKAVRHAEANDELRSELHSQINFDDEIIEVLHSIRPPENLRQKLDVLGTASNGNRKPANISFFNPAILCAVFGILLLVGFGVYLKLESNKDFPGKNWAVSLLELNDRMTGAELEPTKLAAGDLADNMMLRGFDRFALRAELNAVPAVGWRVFRHSGNKVAQIALDREGPGGGSGKGVLVFVFRASDFGVHPAEEGTWKVFDHEVWAAAAVEHGGLCTLMSFRGTPADMERFLHSLKP